MAATESHLGLQLNGVETARTPLSGLASCICCFCCERTRTEYYNMQDGTIWAVTVEGKIGLLRPGGSRFQTKFHARNYFSWRYATVHADSFYRAPGKGPPALNMPSIQDVGFKGSIMFPYFKDLIGFQVDVDRCVIFNNAGVLLYDGWYDGRRFPLMFNGETNRISEVSEFYYVSAPVVHPIINKSNQLQRETNRWGPPGRIRLTAEMEEWTSRRQLTDAALTQESSCLDEQYAWVRHRGKVTNGVFDADWVPPEHTAPLAATELTDKSTRVVYDQFGIGLTAVAWTTVEERGQVGQLCGYTTASVTASRYSKARTFGCECGGAPPVVPDGELGGSLAPVMPRDRVKEAICRPPPCDYAPAQEVFLCEDREFETYHACETTFQRDIGLAQQIQGFDLSLCGNFVHVVYRTAKVQNNKWHRYVGNVPTKEHLPVFIPKGSTYEQVQQLVQQLPNSPGLYAQDDWGVPKWWFRFVQTYYLYGAHQQSQAQWMLFDDQERKDIENIKWLNLPGTLADEERADRCAADPEDKKSCTPFCPPIDGAEKVMTRTPEGVRPPMDWDQWFLPKETLKGDPVGQPTASDAETEYSPYYGIQRLDVISVGPEGSHIADSQREWYFFTGFEWQKGRGTYQDLKNWQTGDLSYVFYKGVENLNQCSPQAQLIPAGLDKLSCCGDYLLVGLRTAFGSRMVFFKETKLVDYGLAGEPSSEDYQRESFACCPTFFAYAMHLTATTYESVFYSVELNAETGDIQSQNQVWTANFDNIDNPPPQFVNDCNPACRYYFARQSDKKGQYFYRDYDESDGTYGPWRHIKSLNISTVDNPNTTDASGCVSTTNVCYIPCEGDGQSGRVKWYKGSQFDAVCDATESYSVCETRMVPLDCEGTAQCTTLVQGYYGGGTSQEEGAMRAVLVLEQCQHFAMPPAICGAASPRWNSETITVSAINAVAWGQFDSCVRSPVVGYTTSLHSDWCYPGESLGGDNIGGEGLAGCENTLYSLDGEGMVVDSVTIDAVPGWEWRNDYPVTVAWSLGWSHGCGGAGTVTTCGLCAGKEATNFTQPCQGYANTGGCWSETYDWSFGSCPGGICSHYNSTHTMTCANVGSMGESERYHEAVRNSDAVYTRNKWTGEIVTCHTGASGKISSYRRSGYNPQNPCAQSDDAVGVCFMGESWTAVFEDGSDTMWLYRVEHDDIEKTVNCKSAVMTGTPLSSELHTYHQINPGNNILQCVLDTIGCCNGGGMKCGDAVAQLYKGNIVVDLNWRNSGYRWTVSGLPVTDDGDCSFHGVRFVCCGPYTLLHTELRYLDIPIGQDYGDEWSFQECCSAGTGLCAVLRNSITRVQEVFIEGVRLSESDIFQGNPYGTAVNDYDAYPVTVESCQNYYLVSCHVGNKINWARLYEPDDLVRTVREAAFVDEENPQAPAEFDFETIQEFKDWWLDRGEAKMILLDGAQCKAYEPEIQELKERDPSGQVRIGPRLWIVDVDVSDWVVRDAYVENGREIYPAVQGFIFRDPMSPWWDKGKTGQDSEELQAVSTEGTLSLMRSLMGVDIESERDYEHDPVRAVERQIEQLRNRLENNKHLIHAKSLEAAAMQYGWGMQHLIAAINVQIQGLLTENVRLEERIRTLTRHLEILLFAPPTAPPDADGYLGNRWLFGFTVEPGNNIAAAYYCKEGSRDPQYLFSDSRLMTVRSYSEGEFGMFYFVAAGYYWWDIPFVERRHRHEVQSGSDSAGLPTYTIYKSHFDLFMGIPNPLSQYDLYHEQPANAWNWQTMGNWWNEYTPHGVYVYNKTGRVSDSLDVAGLDDIEPPNPIPVPQLTEKLRPPYHQGWKDTNHDYGKYLFMNDRNAPVRYDRALSWDKPFEDDCDRSCFKFRTAIDYLRSAVADSPVRMVFGGNGVLHVFDRRQGRMDFDAATLNPLED